MTKKLLVGADDFSMIRQSGAYYVDKTLLIRDLLNASAHVTLFTRPRRFGKSLNMDMLKCFFDYETDKSIFDGLAIMQEKELCDQHMGKYPVILMTLKEVKALSFDALKSRLALALCDAAEPFEHLRQSDKLNQYDKQALDAMISQDPEIINFDAALKTLTKILKKHYGQKAILLIDEYDVPLNSAYENGFYREMIDLLRTMFGAGLKSNRNLQFAVLTGCLRVAKESIFTGLNNLVVHTISDESYDEYFGFSEAEVKKLLNDFDFSDKLDTFREWYDGYRFGEQEVYCPWDVLNHTRALLKSCDAEPQLYWANTSENGLIRRLIENSDTYAARTEIEELLSGKTISKTINEMLTHEDVDKDINNLWSLLFMTGYLTMADAPKGDVYTLKIPNREVHQIFAKQLIVILEQQFTYDQHNLAELFRAFDEGNAELIEKTINLRLMHTISYYDSVESFYHGYLFALLSTCKGWSIKSNREAGMGRSDIQLKHTDTKKGIIVEVKQTSDASELDKLSHSAIKQIIDHDYMEPLREEGIRDEWLFGAAFCKKECRVTVQHYIDTKPSLNQ